MKIYKTVKNLCAILMSVNRFIMYSQINCRFIRY